MNKEDIKKIAQVTGALGLLNFIRRWYDNATGDRFECGIGDILLMRDVPSHNQLLLTSRLMDVEDYLSGKDQTFPWQNTISRKAYGERHQEERGNRSFEALIESYKKDGYHSNSYITCDRNLNLMDGNHRMGLHIYEKIDTVSVRRVHRLIPFQYGGDWYYQVGLPAIFIDKIYRRFKEVQNWLVESGNTFCIVLEGDADDIENMMLIIPRLCEMLKDRKTTKGRLVQFRMQTPKYDVVKGKLVSRRAQEIEMILKSRAANRLDIKVTNNCLEGKELFKINN